MVPATTYSRIALILRCGRTPGFVSGKFNNVACLAQSELKDVVLVIAINCKLKKSWKNEDFIVNIVQIVKLHQTLLSKTIDLDLEPPQHLRWSSFWH